MNTDQLNIMMQIIIVGTQANADLCQNLYPIGLEIKNDLGKNT